MVNFYCPIVSISYLGSVISLWMVIQSDLGNFPVDRDPVHSLYSLVIMSSFILAPFISSYSASIKKQKIQEVKVNGDRQAMLIGG